MVEDGTWVLCDFGSATARAMVYSTVAEIAAEEDVIRKHTTPAYRAPEVRLRGVGRGSGRRASWRRAQAVGQALISCDGWTNFLPMQLSFILPTAWQLFAHLAGVFDAWLC
jgi:hypothetical protein